MFNLIKLAWTIFHYIQLVVLCSLKISVRLSKSNLNSYFNNYQKLVTLYFFNVLSYTKKKNYYGNGTSKISKVHCGSSLRIENLKKKKLKNIIINLLIFRLEVVHCNWLVSLSVKMCLTRNFYVTYMLKLVSKQI